MGIRGQAENPPPSPVTREGEQVCEEMPVPAPTASYRRRAWVQFQRALDPLAPVKPLPPPRS